MNDKTPPSVLKRKVEAGASFSGRTAMTPKKALQQALAKTAQDLMQLPVEVMAVREMRLSLAEIPEQMAERSLLAIVAGPGDGLGLVALAPATLTTLIEMQTTGRISTVSLAPRRPTRTDAAMTSQFINQVLGEVEVLLATDPAIIWAGGFQYSSYLDDPRPLALLLEDVAYRAFQISLRFGEEPSREGQFFLALPADGRGPGLSHCGDDGTRGGGGPARQVQAEWDARIEHAVMEARARIEVVLDRLSLPLGEVLALKSGSLVRLPPKALDHVRVEGSGRRFVAHAKLGQCQNNLAVRVFMEMDAEKDEAISGVADQLMKVLPGRVESSKEVR
ncbi:MAG: FliM/FliN family flagellar motor C-terminal domain-containing protein [Albidovulum sp.]